MNYDQERVRQALLTRESHTDLLSLARRCEQMSRNYISSLERQFERAEANFRFDPDTKSKPTKLIVPITYAQVITNASVLMEMFFGRKYVFELESAKPEWMRGAKLMQVLLQYQLRRQSAGYKVYNWLLSSLIYGFGVLKTYWVEEQRIVRVREEPQNLATYLLRLLGREVPKVEVDRLSTVYCGNEFENVAVRDWRPDPRVPLARFQEGEFCGSEMKVAWNYLKKRESSLGYVGLDKIESMTDAAIRGDLTGASHVGKGYVKVNEMWMDIVPSRYGLSDETHPQIWLVVLANDCQIIRAEPSNYPHGKFPFDIIEYLPNAGSDYNDGLVGTIAELQELFDWFFNAHVVNVREAIGNRFVYDPYGIESADIKDGKRYIRVKEHAQGQGVDRWIKQFPVMDVTRGHVSDAANIYEIIQRVSGVTDNLQGMRQETRRTATEIANIQRAAIGRMKTQAQLMFAQGFASWGEKLVQNTQAFMTEEQFVKVSGTLPDSLDVDRDSFLRVTPEDIQGLFNIVPLDATLSGDKLEKANRLVSFFSLIAPNPALVQAIGFDVRAFARLVLQLYDIDNVNDIIPMLPTTPYVGNNGQTAEIGAAPFSIPPSGVFPPVSGIGEQTQVANRLSGTPPPIT